MKIEINKDNKEYERMLITKLWQAWKGRSKTYFDASSVSANMDINRMLRNTGVKEPDSIKSDLISSFEDKILELEFFSDGFTRQRIRFRVEKDKAIQLIELLQNFVNAPTGEKK